jgi:hypothetical protein
MKSIRILIFILALFVCFNGSVALAENQGQLEIPLQPLPSDALPYISGNINENDLNSTKNSLLAAQMAPYDFDPAALLGQDTGYSYVDTESHRLFVADTENNRVLVFDLDSNNALIDSTPDNVLGQPDFITTTPGSGQSELNNPSGIAYDPSANELFVADTNNNRVMVFDTLLIDNGQAASEISFMGGDQPFSLPISSDIVYQLKSSPGDESIPSGGNRGSLKLKRNSTALFFVWAVILVMAGITVYLYYKPKKKSHS